MVTVDANLIGVMKMSDRIDLLKKIENLERENSKLEKALDRACEELETFDMAFNDSDYCDVKNRYEWKEWCLKDE